MRAWLKWRENGGYAPSDVFVGQNLSCLGSFFFGIKSFTDRTLWSWVWIDVWGWYDLCVLFINIPYKYSKIVKVMVKVGVSPIDTLPLSEVLWMNFSKEKNKKSKKQKAFIDRPSGVCLTGVFAFGIQGGQGTDLPHTVLRRADPSGKCV